MSGVCQIQKARHRRFRRTAALVVTALMWAGSAWAEHFDITLTVEGADEKQEAYSDESPPVEGLHTRPVFHGKVSEAFTLQFFMTYVNPHDVLKQGAVHYFLAPIGKVGQKELPSLAQDVVAEGRLVLDFKTKGRAGLKQQFRISRPGVYLLRVESEGSKSDHEHFSAIELDIK